MLVAVLERVVVHRLGEDRRDLVAADIGDERAHVLAHVRVRRTEVGRVPVAERVDGDAVLVLVRPVGVQEDRPRVDAHAARGSRAARLGEHVPLERLRVDARLEASIEAEVRREVELAAREQPHLPPRVVREDVARQRGTRTRA